MALALLLAMAPGSAKAAPDVDGAVSALIALPFDAAGDLFGAAGLMIAAVGGGVGDVVAIVDNNEYSGIVLRGLLSTPIRRLSLGVSRISSGVLEGFKNNEFDRFPEPASSYLGKDSLTMHDETFGAGLGAAGLSVVDALANTGLVLTRAVGANDQAKSLAEWQDGLRDRWIGPAPTPEIVIQMIEITIFD
jgi:hypothetical protein